MALMVPTSNLKDLIYTRNMLRKLSRMATDITVSVLLTDSLNSEKNSRRRASLLSTMATVESLLKTKSMLKLKLESPMLSVLESPVVDISRLMTS